MKSILSNLLKLRIFILAAVCLMGETTVAQDLMSDTWVGTDALGRTMPTANEVGTTKQDKPRTVGIFYITWHTQGLHNLPSPYLCDVTKVLDQDPDARINGESKAWTGGSYHWGEPEYGYFLSQDRYVIRHDISMLADAGVDVLIFDVTNAVCYFDEWDVILHELELMKAEGNPVPKVCFWTYNGNVLTTTQRVYERYYRPGLYSDLWFYWDDKPLLLCNMRPELDANGGGVVNANPNYDAQAATDPTHPHYGDPDYTQPTYTFYSKAVQDFFTLRNMWWGYEEWGGQPYVGTEDNWCFGYQLNDPAVAARTPEQLAARHQGRAEQMAVTPAQHPISITGKCWRRETGEPKLNGIDMPDSAFVPWLGRTVSNPEDYGIYFQDRWDEALQVDPDFLYLNDWNEWTAGKYVTGKAPGSEAPGPTSFLGRDENTFYFVDQYNAEFNRTISPARGSYGDNYYMQMAENIRRYKGVRPIPVNHGFTKASVDGRFEEWQTVSVSYRDTRGDVIHRDHDGYGGLHYTNNTGRNDIVLSKVSLSRRNIFFYAQTAEALTPDTDNNWMLLFIDADQNHATGWEGYDYLVCRSLTGAATENTAIPSEGMAQLLRYDTVTATWIAIAALPYAARGNELELSLPRRALGLRGSHISFDFKWCDNPQMLTDAISLCTDGDAAPNRRFNYRCLWKKK